MRAAAACADEIHLVEQDHIGEGDLLEHDRRRLELLLHVQRIDQRHDGVERVMLTQLFLDEEGLRHRTGVGKSGGLDEHRVEALAAPAQLPENADQIAAHGAAQATVAGLEDLLLGPDHQRLIDTDLAELVLDHRDAPAVLLGENTIDQRGLAGSEKAGQHRDGNTGGPSQSIPGANQQSCEQRNAQQCQPAPPR